MNKLKHLVVVLTMLFLLLGIPTLLYVDIPALLTGSVDVDAVTRASMELPEQPSGRFWVLLNIAKHLDTAQQWEVFFSGDDAGVIMSDIDCMVIDADATGIQLAERFQARLPENQMQIDHENGLLLASKAEIGLFDVIILSCEMADAYGLHGVCENSAYLRVMVQGE